MRKILVLIAAGWLLMCSNFVKADSTSQELNAPAVEINFTPRITAQDLQIKHLTAKAIKDSVLFTLTYSSEKDRYLCFFNPPQGDVFKYLDNKGIKKSDSIVHFSIAQNKFQSVNEITIRFSIHSLLESDRNFIYLDKDFVKGLVTATTTQKSCSNFFAQYAKNTAFHEFKDVRWRDLSFTKDTLSCQKITTLTFNKDSKFGNHTTDADLIIEKGKSPGLGVSSLHKQGITGKGVRIAIIDQNLPGTHPEYAGKIVKYQDVGCKQPRNKGSMHGPGVLSLLAGTTIGTAPDAQIYFAAAPSWTADAKYEADALTWIVEENRHLPGQDKIRLVSISGAPSGPGTPFTKNNALWDEAVKIAEQEGILVLDCTKDHGFIGPCYYDASNPDDVKGCHVGWPDKVVRDSLQFASTRIFAPCSGRTIAEEYEKGINSYQYCGKGGLSWAIPYVAGVMAMGWQVKPQMNGTEMVAILLETSIRNDLGYKIINPEGFISRLQQIP